MDIKETIALSGTTPFEETANYSLVAVPKGTSQLAADKVTDTSIYVARTTNPAQAVLVNPSSSTEQGGGGR